MLKPGFVADNRAALAKVAARTGRCAAIVGFVDAGRDLHNAAAVCIGGEVAGRLPQAPPAELRRVRRAALLHARQRAARAVRHRRGPRRREHLRGRLEPERPHRRPGPGRRRAGRQHQRVAVLRRAPRRRGSACWPPGPPTRRARLVYVNQVGGQDELVFDGASMVFDADGELVSPGPAVHRGDH